MNSEVSTRMVIASDYTLTREGLRSLFRDAPEVAIVGEAESIAITPHRVKELVPDVVLIEISSPGRAPGLRAVAEIGNHSPDARMIVLTNNSDLPYARCMLAKGVSGYLLKTSDSLELFTAVRNVRRGGNHIDSSLSGALLWHAVAKKRKSIRPTLSWRELEVLKALVRGHTNTQVAQMLKVSVKTVETYRLRICRKLHVRNRAEIVEYASTHRLLDHSE